MNLKELELCPMIEIQTKNKKLKLQKKIQLEKIINSITNLINLQNLKIGYIFDLPTTNVMMTLSRLCNLRFLHIEVIT